jgi:catechol 2,3-dioxygenase-like lactoylglutathione lyase family enzyme
MAKIRHVAIMAKDPNRLSQFYQTTFGMKEVARGQSREDSLQAIYLSDGYINLAILPARGKPEGINHFGFQVDDIRETGKVAMAAGATQDLVEKPRDGRFAEFGIKDPVGVPVDLSEHGWRTEKVSAAEEAGKSDAGRAVHLER